MSTKQVKTRIQNKHDLECNWIKATGFCPMEGELIIYDIEVDGSDNVLAGALEGTGRTEPYKHVRYKIGDGIHYVNDLPFVSEGVSEGTTSTGPYSHAEGSQTIAEGKSAHSEGYLTKATGDGAHAEGHKTLAQGDFSHAQGNQTQALGSGSAAAGYKTTAGYITQFVIGRVNDNKQSNLFEIGNGRPYYKDGNSNTGEVIDEKSFKFNSFEVDADGVAKSESFATKSTILNRDTFNIYDEGNPPIIIPGSIASGLQSVAFGQSAEASGDASFAQGVGVKAVETNQAVFGKYNAEDKDALFIVGNGDETSKSNAFQVMASGTIQAPNIQQAPDKVKDGFTFKNKNANAAALDVEVKDWNDGTELVPYGATGEFASAFGGKSAAMGKRSHAEGTTTIAKGKYSHVEGDNSVTLGDDSHAEGYSTVAYGSASHAEGSNTQAKGSYSHAEGYSTIAQGSDSHAEGDNTVATGHASHAGGQYSRAVQKGTFAHGDHVITSAENQAVFGKYNKEDTDALFIVGNGTSDSDRKNAFTVKTDGTAECVDLKVTGEVSNGTNTFYFPETSGTLALTNDIPSTTSELTNDSGFITIDHNHNNLYYTESEVDAKIAGAISSVLKYKGTKSTTSELPASGNTTGDVWNITNACAASGTLPKVNAGDNVAWNGNSWDVLAGTVDLSGYSIKGHTHTKSDITDFAHNHDDRYYTETEVNDRIAIIAGLGDNSIQKKSGVNLASDNVLLTIANIDITTTPTALGEGATALGSSYQITCTSDTLSLKPRIKLTAKNGYNFTFSLNTTAATLVKTLTDQYKAQAENGAPSFYLKFGTNYLLITDYTNLTLNEFLGATTGGSVTLIAPSTVSQTIVDNIAVNAYVDKVISCVAGGKESFVANSGMAPGERAFAVNTMTQAIGQASAAFGGCSVAGATYSAAFANSIVWGPSSLGGGNCYIGTNASTSIGNGHGCSTDGPQSAIFGFKNTIGSNGNQAFVIGALNNSNYQRTFIGGHGNIATHDDQVVLGTFATPQVPEKNEDGTYKDNNRDYFVVGCGSSSTSRANAFKVTNQGIYGLGTSYQASSQKITCTKLATESWVTSCAVGTIGYKSTAAGNIGAVLLYNNINDGSDGFQIAVANGFNAVSLGKGARAETDMSFATNNQTTAAHSASAAFGYKTKTTHSSQLVCGSGEGNSTENAYFRVACGSKDGLAVLTNGNVNISGNLTLGKTTLTEANLSKLIKFINEISIKEVN